MSTDVDSYSPLSRVLPWLATLSDLQDLHSLSQFKRALGRAKFLAGWIFQAGCNDGESWNWGKAAAK